MYILLCWLALFINVFGFTWPFSDPSPIIQYPILLYFLVCRRSLFYCSCTSFKPCFTFLDHYILMFLNLNPPNSNEFGYEGFCDLNSLVRTLDLMTHNINVNLVHGILLDVMDHGTNVCIWHDIHDISWSWLGFCKRKNLTRLNVDGIYGISWFLTWTLRVQTLVPE